VRRRRCRCRCDLEYRGRALPEPGEAHWHEGNGGAGVNPPAMVWWGERRVEQPDAADEAGASVGASPLIWVLGRLRESGG
jgi:hypothetical protein